MNKQAQQLYKQTQQLYKQTQQLYQIVPAVYRNRDTGDLKKYFTGTALLLDQIQQTLEQKYADNFPDSPIDDGLSSQEWLLPYFADLLDVNLISPLTTGKREEISNAIQWRQSKGTLQVIEEVAEAIGQLEVIIQEGWQRVSMTPRLNQPHIPATAYGYSTDVALSPPSIAARHPGLPAMTVDFRCYSGAWPVGAGNLGTQQTTVDGETRIWRQTSFHGAPCRPDHFDDVSARTVDLRTPDWRIGHYHPDHILIYMVPPAGFFPKNIVCVDWTDEASAVFLALIDIITTDDKTTYRNKTFTTEHFRPVCIRNMIKPVPLDNGVGSTALHTWRFEGLVLEDTLEVDSGRVELESCAVHTVNILSSDTDVPVVVAKNSLINKLQAADSLVQLEYCTLLDTTISEVLNASDCIFTGKITKDDLTDIPPEDGCLRYCAILPDQQQGNMSFAHISLEKPVFFTNTFGDRSCAVLHPATPSNIRLGSADGNEMGAYHFQFLSLLPEAVTKKLRDYLPVGLEVIIIPDKALINIPSP